MSSEKKVEGMLSPYRVLDLTDEKGLMCGKLLGDLGADVIKIERPGGDHARNIGPFYHNEADPEKSLYWFAVNTSKRGITLDIETADGREIFKKLVKSADFVIESYPPGYMDKLGLGYSALEELNPRIIMVSITPFGQTGPYRDYKGPDIVVSAMGGLMYIQGDPDRPPVRATVPQAYIQGGVQGALGSLAALYHRDLTGEGQQVDVALQECMAVTTDNSPISWDHAKVIITRQGSKRRAGNNLAELVYPTRDGHVCVWAGIMGGQAGAAFLDWMASEGMAGDLPRGEARVVDVKSLIEGDAPVRTQEMTQEMINHREEISARFFESRGTEETVRIAQEKGLELTAMCTAKDILEDTQLADRNYFVQVEHPELNDTLTYLGNPWAMSEAPWRISRRAPLIGEHNSDIYENELGLSKSDLVLLRQAKVI